MKAFRVSKTMMKNTKILTDIHQQKEMNRAIVRIIEEYFNDNIDDFMRWFGKHDDEHFGLASEGINEYQNAIHHWQLLLKNGNSSYSDNLIKSIIKEDKTSLNNFKTIPHTDWCVLRKDGITGMLRPLDILAIIGTIKYHTKNWNIRYYEDAMKHYGKYKQLLQHLTAPLTFQEATMN